MDLPESIPCVDCGQPARRLHPEPEEGWQAGDFVAYRCTGCHDRWDMEVGGPGEAGAAAEDGFDFRRWLASREGSPPGL